MSDRALIANRDSSFVISFHERVLVAITDGHGTLPGINTWRSNTEMLARTYPDGIGMFFVVSPGAHVPVGEVRTRANDLFTWIQGRVKVLAAVIEGSGFGTAAKRAAFALIVNASIGKVPLKVFSEIPAACDWMAAEAAKVGLPCPRPPDLWKFVLDLPRPTGR
jgi:hypothetical protein